MTVLAKENGTKAFLTALEAQNSDTTAINAKLMIAMGFLYTSLTLLFVL